MQPKILRAHRGVLIVSILATILVALIGCSAPPVERVSSGKNILGVVPHGFGINYYLLQDVMDQYGWNVTYAGLTDSVEVCGPFAAPRGGLAMGVDTLLSGITDIEGYDAVVLLTSTQFSEDEPYADILGSEHAMNLIASAAEKDIPIFTSCAGVRILATLDLINGLSVTGSKRFQAEFEAAGATFLGVDPAPQILGNLITSSRGQYNNVPNGVVLSTLIEHRETPTSAEGSGMDTTIGIGPIDFAGAESVWAYTYGGMDADGGRDILQTEDGGFLIIGYTFSTGTGIADIMAVKTDDSGKIVWWNTYGGNGTEYGYACTEIDDGFLVTGYTTSPYTNSTDKQAYLLKIDPDGSEIWSQTFGSEGSDVGTDVIAVDDGYIVCGFTESNSAGETDIYLLKTDLEGKELWSKTFGGQYTDMGNSVHRTSDGGLIIGATTNSFGGGNSDFYLIKTDADGNETWANAYHPTGEHGHGFDWGNSMCVAPNGSFYITGYSDCDDLMNAYVIKIDPEGQEVWARTVGEEFYDYGNAVCAGDDGSVLVCGTTKALFNNNDLLVAKLDTDGNIVWEKKAGGDGTDWGSAMTLTSDGNCVVVGHTNSYGKGSFDFCALKIDSR